MMDLDSAIQHCKGQVQEQAKRGCYSCAEEHQQLAEWLKELKACREERRMKLLIDIPEHIYEHAKEMTEDSRDEGEAMRAIANGTQQESRSEIPNTCGDAISRQAVLNLMRGLTRWCVRSEDGKWKNVGLLYDDVMFGIDRLPSVTPQPCGDAISREEMIKALDTWDKFGYAPTNELVPLRGNVDKDKYVPYIHYDDVLTCIRNMPLVTPQQRMGRWEEYYTFQDPMTPKYRCSICKEPMEKILDGNQLVEWWSDYCPKCGAKMEVDNG